MGKQLYGLLALVGMVVWEVVRVEIIETNLLFCQAADFEAGVERACDGGAGVEVGALPDWIC